MGRIERALGARHAPWIVIAIGIALAAPALTADFAADDHLHRVVAREDTGISGLPSRPLDLFVFANGDPATTAQFREQGLFPWWTDDTLKLSFWRPISSATHAIDHALWPDSSTAQLAHNLAWHALVLVLVWLFYRRFLAARWIAVLALALYAFDDARGPVVGWIANRNALVALSLALPVLLAHDRWRRDGWSPGRWLAPVLFVVALGAGESSLAIAAYLAAHALWLDRGSLRDRVLALAPYVALTIAWRIVYTQLGYGVHGSGIYLDPSADVIAFANAAATRIPFLLQSQFMLPWSDFASVYPVLGLYGLMLLGAVVTVVMLAIAFARLVRRDRVARFFATGMLLAAVPIASTFPADRLLGFVALGAFGLVAQFLAAALRDRALLGDGRVRRISALVLAVLFVLLHLVLAPPFLVLRSRSMVAVGRVIDRADAGVPHDASIADKTVIIVAPPSDALAGYIPIMRMSRHQPRPAHLYWLTTATSTVTLTRVDDRTLRVSCAGGCLRYELDQMLRSPRERPFVAGDRVTLTNLTLEIETVADGRPLSVLAHVRIPLDDPSLIWLRFEGKSYVAYRPPAIGASDSWPPVDFGKLLE